MISCFVFSYLCFLVQYEIEHFHSTKGKQIDQEMLILPVPMFCYLKGINFPVVCIVPKRRNVCGMYRCRKHMCMATAMVMLCIHTFFTIS